MRDYCNILTFELVFEILGDFFSSGNKFGSRRGIIESGTPHLPDYFSIMAPWSPGIFFNPHAVGDIVYAFDMAISHKIDFKAIWPHNIII